MNFSKVIANNEHLSAIRQALLRLSLVGYCESLVCKRLKLSSISDLSWRLIPVYRKENLIAQDILNYAIDLFLLQGEVESSKLSLLFGQETLEGLIDSGLLIAKEGGSSPRCLAIQLEAFCSSQIMHGPSFLTLG